MILENMTFENMIFENMILENMRFENMILENMILEAPTVRESGMVKDMDILGDDTIIASVLLSFS